MSELFQIILATAIISSGSLAGILSLSFNQRFLNKFLLPLVSLSAGTMLGAAFLHLLPESIELLEVDLALQLALASFLGFFLLERFLHWRHCHHHEHVTKHTLGTMNLIGDGIHNFLDGILIAASFATDPGLGLASALAVALHEIPQELGDFGVLLHSGFSRRKAIIANLLVSLTAVAGGVLGYLATHTLTTLSGYLLPIAAGGFLYIAAADLVPELKEATSTKKTISIVLSLFLGIILMTLIKE